MFRSILHFPIWFGFGGFAILSSGCGLSEFAVLKLYKIYGVHLRSYAVTAILKLNSFLTLAILGNAT